MYIVDTNVFVYAVGQPHVLRGPALDAFDTFLAAVAIRENAEGLVSADRAFRDVPGLHWIDLATLDVSTLTG